MTEQELLKIRIEMERLITAREGMIAINQYRVRADLAQAYDEKAFIDLSNDFEKLLLQLREGLVQDRRM